MTDPNASAPGWERYWLVWFVVMFTSFIGPEIWALCTNWRNTLSATIWHLEDLRPGQPVSGWSAFHFLFIGLLLLVDVWLLGHFAFGWWRK